MKKNALILLMALILLLQTGCSESQSSNTYTVQSDEIIYTIDNESRTISDGEYTYTFEVDGSGSIKIIYPDGSYYAWTTQGNIGYGGWSEDYDPDKYVDGDKLYEFLLLGNPDRKNDGNPGNVFAGLLLLGIGLWNLISPQTSWYLSHGWKYKNAEPSDCALAVNRIGGGLAVIIAIMLFISSC